MNSSHIHKWGIIGTGNMGNQFAKAILNLQKFHPNTNLAAVYSRNQNTALQFGLKYNIPSQSCFDDLFKMIQEVSHVYIASVSASHFEQTKFCLENKKNVLCEKPLTLDAQEIEQLKEIGNQNGVFLMEGLWSRFFPINQIAQKLVQDSVLGDIGNINCDLQFYRKELYHINSNLVDPKQGGSCMFGLGIYTLNLPQFYINRNAQFKNLKMIRHNFPDTPTDEQNIVIFNIDNVSVSSTMSIKAMGPQTMFINGKNGSIRIKRFHCPSKLVVDLKDKNFQHENITKKKINSNGTASYTLEVPIIGNGSGLEYECLHLQQCVENGLIESPIISLNESKYICSVMQQLLKENQTS